MTDVEIGVARVLIVDDHPLFRDGLCRLVEQDRSLRIVGAVGTAIEAIDVARSCELDLAIVDCVLPTSDGIGVTARLKRLWPRCRVLGLSNHDDPRRVAAMFRAGADGFAIKTQAPDEILCAIRSVCRASRYLSPAIDADAVAKLAACDGEDLRNRLTEREREIYDLLVNGESNEQIATRLFITRRTVETHRQHVLKKLGVSSVADLLRFAYKLGH